MRSNYSPKNAVELEDLHHPSSNSLISANFFSPSSLKHPRLQEEEKTPENQNKTSVYTINAKFDALEKVTGSHHAITQWRNFFSKGSPHIDTLEFKTTHLAKLGEISKVKNALPLFNEISQLIDAHNAHIKKHHFHFQSRLFQHYREQDKINSSDAFEENIEKRIVLTF